MYLIKLYTIDPKHYHRVYMIKILEPSFTSMWDFVENIYKKKIIKLFIIEYDDEFKILFPVT